MTHMVAYYPDAEASFEATMGLVEGGATHIEVQFPFSDPQADGPAIQEASGIALEAGFTVWKGFDLIERIRASCGLPVFLMTYGNLPFTFGIPAFVKSARESGCTGIIVPDLCLPHDEGLAEEGKRVGIEIVPVVAPNITESRLAAIGASTPRFIYAAIRRGITGRLSTIDEATIAFIAQISASIDFSASSNTAPTAESGIFAGFGLSTRSQVEEISPLVLAPVVGSVIVRTIKEAVESGRSVRDATRAKVQELAG
jgi:tryptophan synthase alpha chain